MLKKKVNRAIVFLTSLLLSLILFFGMSASIMKVFAAGGLNFGEFVYLSDIPYSEGSKAAWVGIKYDKDGYDTTISLRINDAWKDFEKGVFASANSAVIYDIRNYNYKYFTAYVGIEKGNVKNGDGAKFFVYTSADGTTWTLKSSENPNVLKPDYNAEFLSVNISGAKYLKLVTDMIASEKGDQTVWADAKLTNAADGNEMLTYYDDQIKAKLAKANLDDKQANLFADKQLEKLVLQREFVRRLGQTALKKFTTQCDESTVGVSNEDNEAVLDWLLNDLDSLREFMMGGAPFGGSYYNSLIVLSKLYKHYKTDLDDARPLKYNKWVPGRTYGELYRTMMFSVALTHDKTIGSYLQASRSENQSQPLRRYAIYRYLYETERFVATESYETMNLFGSLKVEEMRWLMSNIIDDESILWLNDYVQTRINANPKNAGNLHTPHSYVRYTDPNYNNPVFYANENYDYFNKLFAVDYRGDNGVANNDNKYDEGTVGEGKVGLWDTSYTVPAGEGDEPFVITVSRSGEGEAKLQKVWMNFNNKFKTGSVCGGISKSGCNIRGARGIPANVIGQPGHAAILYYSKDANGNGNWKIDNDVGGWLAATKGERHLLGWGNAAWQRNSGGTVVYFHLAQACLNDYDNFVKAEEYCWLADVYKGDLAKQEKLYEKALTTQILNLDAWYGLAMTYKANTAKTAADFSTLAGRIGDTLWNHPVAMHCLFRLFTDEANAAGIAALQDPVFTLQIKSIEINALAKAKASGSTAAKSKVNYLLGIDLTSDIADFSFDGENAGCIVWVDDYADGTFTWKYSLDGKKTWKEVTFNEGDSHAYQLSEKELSSISAENNIYVYIVGASPDNAYRIDVGARPIMPDTLYANDWENRVIGVDATYEWRYCSSSERVTETGTEVSYTPTTGWISYAEASPDCSGNKAIEVRLKGTAKKPASESKVFTFTADTDTKERKYISVNYLSMFKFSTESQDAGRPNYAVNAIDGNAKTYWHTDYSINIKNSTQGKNNTEIPRVNPFLTIKLDVPRWISGLEFAQRQYNASFSIFAKNVKIWVSEDGVNWGNKPAATREGFEEIDDLKTVHFEKPVYGQYVKLEITSLYEAKTLDGVFTTVSLVNLYEDTTKTTTPGGAAMPSLSEVTPSGNAFAGLGGIIGEDKALEIGGAPDLGGTGSPRKSNAGLVAALVIVGVVLVAGAAVAVFVLLKRKKAVAGGPNKPEKAGKPKASKTAAPKATPKATPAETPKATPKASTAAPKASTPAPKASTPAPKASTPAPKASTPAPKVINAAPKASAPAPKASTPAPKASTPAPKASTPAPKASTPAPKASTPAPKASTPKPKNK